MERNEFKIKTIRINGRSINKVIVDCHVKKHADITDNIILDLVQELDGIEQQPDDRKDSYEYYVNFIELNKKQYRIVWLLEDHKVYIGIVTVFRDKKGSKK